MNTVNTNTTLRVSKELRNMLNKIGERGETYEDIIRRLLKNYKEVKRND